MQRLRDRCAAGDQAAAAHRRHEQIELGYFDEQLECDRARARHDERIVVGLDEGEPTLRRQPCADVLAIVCIAVIHHDLGSVAARCLELRVRGVLRHHDRRARAEQARGERHRLRMIPRGVREHAPRSVVLVERHDLVVRTAELERTTSLETLRLHVHGCLC